MKSPILTSLDLSREALKRALHEVRHNTPEAINIHYTRVFGSDYAKYMSQQLEHAIGTIGFLMQHQEFAEKLGGADSCYGPSQVGRDLHPLAIGEVAS